MASTRATTSPPAPPTVDHSITGRIAAGDERAFARFYEAWFAPTLALARATSRRDEGWCLDVVQDVMLAVARRMPALASDEQLRAWMTRTVVHAVVDRSRAEARRRRREQRVAAATPTEAGEPWHELAHGEREQWLANSVAALSSTDQALLQARFGGASSVTAAAGELGISPDAAHGRLRRTLHKLRQSAAEWLHGT
ncbi:MAG: sigma-70 family RNA polymerase sigma factor [Planctomycetes bacterium]|nr:sigma-70 family RNA polymerase sigma factor [Planctomycetota bacterium]